MTDVVKNGIIACKECYDVNNPDNYRVLRERCKYCNCALCGPCIKKNIHKCSESTLKKLQKKLLDADCQLKGREIEKELGITNLVFEGEISRLEYEQKLKKLSDEVIELKLENEKLLNALKIEKDRYSKSIEELEAEHQKFVDNIKPAPVDNSSEVKNIESIIDSNNRQIKEVKKVLRKQESDQRLDRLVKGESSVAPKKTSVKPKTTKNPRKKKA